MSTCVRMHTYTHTRRDGSPDLGDHPFKNSHVILLSETHLWAGEGRGKERPGTGPAVSASTTEAATLSSVLLCAYSQTLLKMPDTLNISYTSPKTTEELRMLLFWMVVVVNFKNLEESLLRPMHCLLSFLYSCQQGKSQKRETWSAFWKQWADGTCTRAQVHLWSWSPYLQEGS